MPYKTRFIPQEKDLTFFPRKQTGVLLSAPGSCCTSDPPCSLPPPQTQWWQEQDLLSAGESSRGQKMGPDFVSLWSEALGKREVAQYE